jgi:hypothetical protein
VRRRFRPASSEPLHHALDSEQVAIARPGIAGTVELVGEEVDGCPVARIRVQVLVRAKQTPGLPVLQRLEPAH